jgi:hypothetical protein
LRPLQESFPKRVGRWYGSLPQWGQALAALGGLAVVVVVAIGVREFLGDTLGGIIVILILFVAYFFPSFVADRRNVPNKGSVRVINLFLGWTVIGWVVALAMAMAGPSPAQKPKPMTNSPPPPPSPSDIRRCPFCAEDIKKAAIVCKHCGRDVEPAD